jgi:hypothetical protein
MKLKQHSLLVATIAIVGLAGSVGTGCDSTVNNDETAMVSFDLDAVFDGTPISSDPSTVYQLNGRNITLSTARLYLSEVTLLRDDGSEATFTSDNPVTVPAKDQNDNDISHIVEDQIILAKHDLGISRYELGEVESGRYTGVRFKLGIDGLNNRVDATQVPAGHPLAKQTDRNNHWSWNSGYIYLRLDGQVDGDGDGTTESNWETHIGSTNFLNTISLANAFELGVGDDAELHIVIDYAKFLADVDLGDPAQRLCHTMDNLPVAQKVKARVSEAFVFHGVHVQP